MTWNYINRFLQTGPIRFYSVTILGCVLALLVVSFATARDGRTIFGSNLGADFAQFYVAGKIVNEYSAASLYDRVLEQRLYRGLVPDEPESSSLPYFYPPYLALLLSPLARLSYAQAYAVWLIAGLIAYLAGLALLRLRIGHVSNADWTTAVLLALSFSPFALEAWAGGQLSIWGFLLISIVLWADERLPILSGIALAGCSYKPTLVIFVIPMLILTRRWRALAAFAGGVAVLGVFSFSTVGAGPNVAYVNELVGYGSRITTGVVGLRRWKYVDLNSFLTMLVGQGMVLRVLVAASLVVIGIVLLARHKGRIRDPRSFDQGLLWSLTLVATLLFNVYVPIYDCVLLVPAALLAVNYKLADGRKRWTHELPLLLAALHLTAWLTQPFARIAMIQLYTLVLLAFGVYLVRWMLEPSVSSEGYKGPIS